MVWPVPRWKEVGVLVSSVRKPSSDFLRQSLEESLLMKEVVFENRLYRVSIAKLFHWPEFSDHICCLIPGLWPCCSRARISEALPKFHDAQIPEEYEVCSHVTEVRPRLLMVGQSFKA